MRRRPSHRSSPRRCAAIRPGFTLIELLVVIGTLSVLMALFMPAMSRVRETAKQTTCLSNMRQIGLGMHAYAMSYEGLMPPQPAQSVFDFANPAVLSTTPDFLGILLPTLSNKKSLYVCPDAWEIPWVPSEGPNAISSTNYMPNAVIVGKRVTSVRHPSDTIVLQEDKMLWCVCWLRPAPSGSGSGGPLYTDWHWNGDGFGEEYTAIHSNLSGGNVLYVDCHADFRQYQSLHAYDFGLAGGSGASGAASDPDTCSNFGTYYGSP